MKLRQFFALLAFLAASFAQAREITADEAGRAAAAWVDLGYSMGKLAPGRTVAGVVTLRDGETGAELRMATFEGGGYVLLASDDRVDPVIAFSDSGDSVDTDENNPFWALLRHDIAEREEAAGVARGGVAVALQAAGDQSEAGGGEAGTSRARARWAELLDVSRARTAAKDGIATDEQASLSSLSDVRVDALVKSTWGQSTAGGKNCFNAATPKYYVSGCVATAIAQIMRFWQKPSGSVAAHSYECAVAGTTGTYTMKGGTYSWSSMPLNPSYSNVPTDAQCTAIGKLLYDVGVTVQMRWNIGASAASVYSGMPALKEDFGYASAVSIHYSSDTCTYSLSTFKNHVCPSLDAGCPLGMSVPGHAIVVDGYGFSGSDFYIHVNYGWDGSSNAWYCPPDLSAGGYSFTSIQGILCNVSPTKSGNILSGRITTSSGTPVSGATVTLKNGSSSVGSATTDAKGIYAIWAPAGSYTVSATKNGTTASRTGTLGTTAPLAVIGHSNSYWLQNCSLGNSWGNDLTLNAASAPSAPSSVSATDGSSAANCTVSWGAVSGTASYTVYRHTSNASGSATALKSGVTATSYADTSATPGTLYYYWVKAVNSAGTSAFSSSDSGYRKLAAPTISSATGSTTGVALSWGTVTGATHYHVFRATSASGSKTALGSWQTGRTYTDTTGTAGTTYYYFVQAAVSSSGARPSAYSASKTGMKLRLPAVPASVSAADGASTANVAVSWGAASYATGYNVYRSEAGSVLDAVAVARGVTGTSFGDTGAIPGRTYTYWVEAVNAAGASAWSASDAGWRKISNDAFSSPVALSGYSGTAEWGTLGATAQSGEPLHADAANNSAWWTWTAPAKGTVEISTAGSAFDTVLAVYTGTAVGSLSKVAANDDASGASTSRVVFDTSAAGTVYRIAVAGYDGAAGALSLSWKFNALNAATFTDMAFNPSTGVAHVAFKARKGMSYKIQRASSLGGTWTTVKTVAPSATGTVEADVSLPISWKSGFVRVVVTE